MRTLLAGLIAAAAAAPPPPAPSDDVLHKRAIVIDTHADTTQFIAYRGLDIAKPQPEAQLDLPKAAAGGMGALYGLEGAHALLPGDHGAQLEHLRALAARGVRYMTLTWINSNDLGGSSGDAGDVRGLTPFGAEVIKEMNRLGVVVDVSHVSDPMFWDAIRASAKPVLATHSSARELTNIPRNMTDAMLKAVAANGGAVCVNFGSAFLDDRFHIAESAVWAKKRPGPPWEQWRQIRADAHAIEPQVQLTRLLDHIQHVAKVAGADHTCLGSDF